VSPVADALVADGLPRPLPDPDAQMRVASKGVVEAPELALERRLAPSGVSVGRNLRSFGVALLFVVLPPRGLRDRTAHRHDLLRLRGARMIASSIGAGRPEGGATQGAGTTGPRPRDFPLPPLRALSQVGEQLAGRSAGRATPDTADGGGVCVSSAGRGVALAIAGPSAARTQGAALGRAEHPRTRERRREIAGVDGRVCADAEEMRPTHKTEDAAARRKVERPSETPGDPQLDEAEPKHLWPSAAASGARRPVEETLAATPSRLSLRSASLRALWVTGARPERVMQLGHAPISTGPAILAPWIPTTSSASGQVRQDELQAQDAGGVEDGRRDEGRSSRPFASSNGGVPATSDKGEVA
jgi:hypothetical protein